MTMHQAQTAAPEAHTPLPWSLDGVHRPFICAVGNNPDDPAVFGRPPGPDGRYVFGGKLADAEFIVRACNSHDELVEALRTVCAILDDYRAPGDELPAFEDPCELVNELEKRCVHEAITAAIASATGAA